MDETVMGVDACKEGWIGIVWGAEPGLVRAEFGRTMSELCDRTRERTALSVVAIDMPIGLPDQGVRQADGLARTFIGAGRRSSVFEVPVRQALALDEHAAAVLVNRSLTGGRGMSIQSFSLRMKIREVEAWLPEARAAKIAAYEAHPEVTFRAMAGSPVQHSKKTWAGARLRSGLLATAGLDLSADLGSATGHAAVDDVLDAAAMAWTARRIQDGTASRLPDSPQVFSDGWPAAIWY